MEHHQRHLHLSPHQKHPMIGPGLFGVDSMHFHGDAGFVEPAAAVVVDDSAWMEDLMHLGDELFGGGPGDNDVIIDMAGDGLAWQRECVGGSPDGHPCSYDDAVSPVSGVQGARRDDGELSGTRKRRDRSKTIVSERKRRFRTKEKLHELRALVPNITKMDKASIIADAVEYIKNLRSHARKLKEEVATLEARPGWPGRQQQEKQGRRQGQHGRGGDDDDDDEGSSGSSRGGGGARVTLVSAAQVGKGRFFVTVECEHRDGVAAPLCAAVESMAGFLVETSNLGCSSDRVVSTLTLKVSKEGMEDVVTSERTVKLWLMAALLSEGFRPEATSEIC